MAIIFEKRDSIDTIEIDDEYLKHLNQITFDNSTAAIFGSTFSAVKHFDGARKGLIVQSIDEAISKMARSNGRDLELD